MIGDDWYLMAVWQYCIFILWPQASFKISASEGHGANAFEGPIGCRAGKPWGSQNACWRCGYPAGDGKREGSESTMLPLVLEVQLYVFCFNWFCMFCAMTLLYFTAIQTNVQGALSASAWRRGKEGTTGASRMKFRFPLLSLGARPEILPVGHCLACMPCSCQAPVGQMDSHIWICCVQ